MAGIQKTIAILPGDGIGPEVIAAATRLLGDCAETFGHEFPLRELSFGGNAIDRCGTPLPPETLEGCRSADAILLGAIGGPKWDSLPLARRPESGLLALRRELGLYINLRPTRLREPLRGISPLRPERAKHCDFEIVRELAGGIYFGEHDLRGQNGSEIATDAASYSTSEIERVVRFAFGRASARHRRLVSVDKANVLATSGLWRKTVNRIAAEFPRVTLEHQYVDNAAMQLVLRPEQFDVIVTDNLFGDILSDEAAALAGSIGLIPSMSRGDAGQAALYEPIHGSAPTLAGQDAANPLGAIFCVSMMLRESFGLAAEAEWIESAVDRVLEHGYRTADIADPKSGVIGCAKMVERIRREMNESLLQTEHYGWGV
jgi:3-isopropylmalate dehydrogenase